MVRFGHGSSRGDVEFSPDGNYFALVTSRGLIETNEIESTIRVFRSAEVRKLLADDGGKPCTPTVVARWAAIPQVEYTGAYEPVITALRWRQNSRSVLFLEQNAQGERQLTEADVDSGSTHVLSPEGYDVVRFEPGISDVVYLAVPDDGRPAAAEGVNSVVRDITGATLTSVLFPERAKGRRASELWVALNGKTRRLINPDTTQPIAAPRLPPYSNTVLSLSPGGQAVILLTPSKTIPSQWERYEPTFSYLSVRSKNTEPSDSVWPAQYALVDVSSGRTEVLINGPSAWYLGSADENQAVWSPDGKEVLLTNTYLPFDGNGGPETSDRRHYCAAAVVQVSSDETSCVTFARYKRASKILTGAAFGANKSTEVILRFWNAPEKHTEERYRFENGTWKPVEVRTLPELSAFGSRASAAEAQGVAVEIQQDLNTPPAVWAKDLATGRTAKVWDPNAQLAQLDLGVASEFRWKDRSGHEWIGGLVMPPGFVAGKRYPLVIQTHGFRRGVFVTDGPYTTAFAARPLAGAGMVVLQMPTRYESVVTPHEASDYIEGYESAVESLVAQGWIDPERVGIIGFSRTCYYVASALITNPTRFAAATIADGADESYMQFLLFGVGRSHDEELQIYGVSPFGDGLRTWEERAPGFHVDRMETPLRIEAIGPYSVLAEWEIYAALWKQGKPVDLVYFPEGQHVVQKPAERLASEQGNVDWFRFWLLGEEDDSPAKADQYSLWRRLRAGKIASHSAP